MQLNFRHVYTPLTKEQKDKQLFNKQWGGTAVEQLTSHIEQARHTTTETRVAYDNSTWHSMDTGYINSTKEETS